MLWVSEEIEVRMGMHIDESGCEIVTPRIDDPCTMRRTDRSGCRNLSDDASTDKDIGHKGRVCGVAGDDGRREEEDGRVRRRTLSRCRCNAGHRQLDAISVSV